MGFLGILINGKRYDHSSAEVAVEGIPIANVQEVRWTQTLEPGTERGTSAVKHGRSRGQYDAEATLIMSKADGTEVKRLLVAKGLGGWGEAEFTVSVTYYEVGADAPDVAVLRGCRITSAEEGSSEGGDIVQSNFSLDVMEIEENGITMVSPRGGSGGAIGAVAGIIGNL